MKWSFPETQTFSPLDAVEQEDQEAIEQTYPTPCIFSTFGNLDALFSP